MRVKDIFLFGVLFILTALKKVFLLLSSFRAKFSDVHAQHVRVTAPN